MHLFVFEESSDDTRAFTLPGCQVWLSSVRSVPPLDSRGRRDFA